MTFFHLVPGPLDTLLCYSPCNTGQRAAPARCAPRQHRSPDAGLRSFSVTPERDKTWLSMKDPRARYTYWITYATVVVFGRDVILQDPASLCPVLNEDFTGAKTESVFGDNGWLARAPDNTTHPVKLDGTYGPNVPSNLTGMRKFPYHGYTTCIISNLL
ncbi:hypothetical protein C8J57DRAFT_1524305 [Mycena rebaudengoi]|nr:hypothetical protein C8J57DRAFT_1524305 [Mycena rebaudengoi]